MNTIRLSITPEIRQVLDSIKLKYPPLSEPEILKVALSELYIKTTLGASHVDMDNLAKKGRSYFSEWLKSKGKDISSIDEDEVYELIKNA
jgi:hypothetical protein